MRPLPLRKFVSVLADAVAAAPQHRVPPTSSASGIEVDAVALFEPESGDGPIADGTSGQPIGLDQLLQRSTDVMWAEAVAILEAICNVLMADTAQPAPEELCAVEITSRGSVSVRSTENPGSPGPRLARILLALTTATTTPVPLRLFITKWASLTGAHSVADFAQELAYFTRPNGPALIKDVYQRCLAAPAVRQPSQEQRPREALHTEVEQHSPRRRHTWFALGAASLSVFSAAAVWLWASSAPSQQGTPNGRQISDASARVAPKTVSGSPTRALRVSRSRSEADSGPAGEISSSRDSVSSPSNVPSFTLLPAPPAVSGAPLPPVATARLRAETSADEDVPETSARNSFAISTDAGRIYSNADSDVQPPGIIAGSLPPPLLQDAREVNTMELVISEQGTVERVRLVSVPRRMPDMMLLSGAKTWKFEPASRDGRSVRYRLLLSWVATP